MKLLEFTRVPGWHIHATTSLLLDFRNQLPPEFQKAFSKLGTSITYVKQVLFWSTTSLLLDFRNQLPPEFPKAFSKLGTAITYVKQVLFWSTHL
jgi:hypothetical protein